jgi:hypothetical protein
MERERHDLRVLVLGPRLEPGSSRLRGVALRDAAPYLVHDGSLSARRFAKHPGQQQVVGVDPIDRVQIERALGVGQLVLLLENLFNRRHLASFEVELP